MIPTTQDLIEQECAALRDLLLAKNRRYGDSALNPVRIFSQAEPLEQINVRIDDKLSRIASGQADDNEDAEQDLIGYLILKRVAQRRAFIAALPANQRPTPAAIAAALMPGRYCVDPETDGWDPLPLDDDRTDLIADPLPGRMSRPTGLDGVTT
jgi:hypothetical protein